jgi:hypothetical protein
MFSLQRTVTYLVEGEAFFIEIETDKPSTGGPPTRRAHW